MKVTALYSTNPWHEFSSRCCHGIFTDRSKALEAIGKLIKAANNPEDYPELSDEDKDLFLRIGQTQGYGGSGEWDSQEFELDEIEVTIC